MITDFCIVDFFVLTKEVSEWQGLGPIACTWPICFLNPDGWVSRSMNDGQYIHKDHLCDAWHISPCKLSTSLQWDSSKRIHKLDGLPDWVKSVKYSADGNQVVYKLFDGIYVTYIGHQWKPCQVNIKHNQTYLWAASWEGLEENLYGITLILYVFVLLIFDFLHIQTHSHSECM